MPNDPHPRRPGARRRPTPGYAASFYAGNDWLQHYTSMQTHEQVAILAYTAGVAVQAGAGAEGCMKPMITAAELAQASVPPTEPELEPTPAEPWEPPIGATRAEYWREYHAWRQANDPEYRARKAAAAVRAKARRKA